MKSVVLVLLISNILLTQSIFCNYYPMNPEACVLLTLGEKCLYSEYENQCLPTTSTNLGCQATLNKAACVSQLTFGQLPVKCYFENRCIEATQAHLINLGCSSNFSQYACMNVKNSLCYWYQSKCERFLGSPNKADTCLEVYATPVVAQLCANIEELKCLNLGFEGGYQCGDLNEKLAETVVCSQPGLSKFACMSVLSTNQLCIFQDNSCKTLYSSSSVTCNAPLNRLACLSITTSGITCEWKLFNCQAIVIDSTTKCSTLKNVNPSACSQVQGLCYYDSIKQQCLEPTTSTIMTCNTPGLSQSSCNQLNMECTFIDGYCASVDPLQLQRMTCSMKLNRQSCTSLMTKYQYCQWAGSNCINVKITQDTNCEDMINVNGNTCQSIIKEGCMYSSSTKSCIKSSINETCGTSFINLLGCVNIQNSQQLCQWKLEQCQTITIVKYQTLCSELQWVNRVTCSKVHQEASGLKRGCYYSEKYFKCQEFDISDTVVSQLVCLQPGLNQIGCSLIRTTGQICRWERTECKIIQTKSEMAQTLCLSLRFVNAAACALTVVNSQHCKYSPEVFSCIPSVDIYKDGCETLGLNDQGCGAIQTAGESCIFDQVNWRCVKLNLTSPNESVINLLNTASCSSNSPTRDVCVAITKPSQKCVWAYRFQVCQTQLVSFNQKCTDFLTSDPKAPIIVNANVCSSIFMDDPDGPTIITQNQGYCYYDKVNSNCILYNNAANPCTQDCCQNLNGKGINAHVCSRYSNQNKYCYFNSNLQCVELTEYDVDITSETLVQQYINNLQLKCGQVNKKACHLIDWSTTQNCLFMSSACINLDYKKYNNFEVFTLAPAITNKYTCTGIEAVITSTNLNKYFSYDEPSKRCKIRVATGSILCSETNINLNACLGLTTDDYCTWDRTSSTCEYLESLSTITTCSNILINQKACNNVKGIACKFSKLNDTCQTSIDYQVDCNYFDTNFTVSSQTCAQIIKDGQSCKYDSTTTLCQPFTSLTPGCNVEGVNSIACYAYTQGYCRWNSTTMSCYEIVGTAGLTLAQQFMTQKCEDLVNKLLCLSITGDSCTWNVTALKCQLFVPGSTNSCPTDNNFYNSKACQSIVKIGSDCVFDSATYKCKPAPSNSMTCTQYPMNKTACLQFTRTNSCLFDATTMKCNILTTPVSECATPNISIEVCTKLNKQCAFNTLLSECQPMIINNNTLCTELNAANLLPNIKSCGSISSTLETKTNTEICLTKNTNQKCEYQKYCQWTEATYSCAVLQIGESNNYTTSELVSTSCSHGQSGPCFSTIIVQQCQSKIIVNNVCKVSYSLAACSQVITASCFYNSGLGGCYDSRGNEKLIDTCESANKLACTQIWNQKLKCSVENESNDYTPTCDVDLVQSKCAVATLIGVTCAEMSAKLVSPGVCATASDACYFTSDLKCGSPSGTLNCEIAGLSQFSCATMPQCVFKDNQCQYANIIPTPVLCSAVQLAPITSEDNYHRSKICSSIVAEPCQYVSSACSQTTLGQNCSQISNIIVSKSVCTSCLNGAYKYNNQIMQCEIVSSSVYQCDNLNKVACQQYTTLIYCVWNQLLYQCQEITSAQAAQVTDCTTLNLSSYPFANASCWIDSGVSNAVAANSTCAQIKAKFGNQKACSVASDACYYDNTTKQCATPIANQVFSCDDIGLSAYSCIRLTFSDAIQNKCYFSNGVCAQITSTSILDVNFVNKFGCLTQNKLWGWDPTNFKCILIAMYPAQICLVFQPNVDIKLYSQFVCSSLTNTVESCYSDGYQCKILPPLPLQTCSTFGLNPIACTRFTSDYCQFTDSKCTQLTNFDQDCNEAISKFGCINLTNRKCSFYLKCQTFSYTPINNHIEALIYTSALFYVYSPDVCSGVNVNQSYLIYNQITKQCQNANVIPLIATCGSLGININACKSKTIKYCKFIHLTLGQVKNNKCVKLERSLLNSFTICDPSLNWYACISLGNISCKFVNDSCTTLSVSETCTSLLLSQTSRYTCATRVDQPCYYDTTTNFCALPATTTIGCTTNGLNQLGCLNNTKNDLCIFDQATSTCKTSFDHNLNCTAFINDKKCWLINKPNQFCYFTNKACTDIPIASLSSCVKPYNTNALTCSRATDVPCQYNKIAYTCQASIPIDCIDNASLNMLACVQSTGTQQCQWQSDKCVAVQDSQLNKIECSQQINKITCINITNPTQFCQFIGGKCQSMTTKPTSPYQCTSLVNINAMNFCEGTIDVACKFDKINKKCIQLFAAETDCARGLNKLACSQIDPIKKCQFDEICYGPNDLVKCKQALVKNICLESTTMSCEWKDDKCIELNSVLLNCKDIVNEKKLVTKLVCNSAKTDSILDACVLNSTTFNCQIIQPKKCEEVENQTSCIQINGLPCIFSNNKCILYNQPTLVDTCAQMNLVGSERACLDVKSKGQYCQYKDYKCIMADPITTTCTSNVSYQSCIFQYLIACVWEITTNSIYDGTITYSYGKCKSVTVTNDMECSINLSFIACMQITKLDQMCQWIDGICQRIISLPTVIGTLTFKLINQNVCSQVNTNDSVQYSTVDKSCQIAKLNTDCITPGLNKVGCLSNTKQPCQWNQLAYQCTLNLKVYELALTTCDIPNVSPFVCQQIIKPFGCYHSNGNCVAIPKTAKCTDAGINMFGCMNISTSPCRWLDNQCLDYQPFSGCLSVPKYVNSVVCSLITDISCQYDNLTNSCFKATEKSSCNSAGLNVIACSEIPNCIFINGLCQLQNNQLYCDVAKSANQQVCANTYDKCRYSILSYGCVPSSPTDKCSTTGLSQIGCASNKSCQLLEKQCKCQLLSEVYPDCVDVHNYRQCSSLDYCYFEVYKLSTAVDLTIYLQNEDQGTCRNKKCEDLDASKAQMGCYNVQLNQQLCYSTIDYKCMAASKCSDIYNYNKSSYVDCSVFEINGTKCADDDGYRCTDLICQELSHVNCMKYQSDCSYESTCKPINCNHQSQQLCKSNICDWNPIANTCIKQLDCASTRVPEQCEIKMEGNRKCGWIVNLDLTQSCVNNPCRYMSVTMGDCKGTHIGNEVCVLLSDLSCVSCEEITEPCHCLEQQQYCELNRVSKKCTSRSCRYYSKSSCPNRCRYIDETQTCSPLCSSLYNEFNCKQAQNCIWHDNFRICQDKEVEMVLEKYILPSLFGILQYISWTTFIILIII